MLTKVNTGGKEFAPTPRLMLTEKPGNYIKGVLKRKIKDSTYPDKLNFFITVKDLEGSTVVWDREAKVEKPLDATVGGDVFVKGFTQLQKALQDIPEGTYVEVIYTGKGAAKKGQRAPYLVDVQVEA